MPIKISCPCGKRLVAQDAQAGKRTKCPACGQVLEIPAADAFQAPPAAGPTPGVGQSFQQPMNPGYPAGMQQPAPGMGYDPLTNLNPAAMGYGAMPPGGGSFAGQAMPGMPYGGMQPGATFMPGGGFAQPPRRKSKGLSTGAILGIIGLAVGVPCLGMGGCVAFGVVKTISAARDAARRASAQSGLPTTMPGGVSYTPPTSYLDRPASAEDQAKHDALMDKFVADLEEYGNLLATINNADTLQRASARMQELANEINMRRIEVQFLPIGLSSAENQRLDQKYGARLKAANDKAQREDARVLQLSLRLPFESLSNGFEPPEFEPPAPPNGGPGFFGPGSTPGGPTAPTGPTAPVGPTTPGGPTVPGRPTTPFGPGGTP